MSLPRRVVVTAEERVRPCARAAKLVVLDDGRAVEHVLLLAVDLEPVVGERPDAVLLADLALPLSCPTAGAVALVLDTLGLGAEVGDVRQRAVAAVPAPEHGDLGCLLDDV